MVVVGVLKDLPSLYDAGGSEGESVHNPHNHVIT